MKKVMSASIDEQVLKLGRDSAHELRVSFSVWVEDAIRAFLNGNPIENQFSETVKKMRERGEIANPDSETKSDLPSVETAIEPTSKKEAVSDKGTGQKNLDAERKSRSIKKDKIETVKGLMGHSGARPKGAK